MINSMTYLQNSKNNITEPRMRLIGDMPIKYLNKEVSCGGYFLNEQEIGQLIQWLEKAQDYMINERQKGNK